MLDMIVSLKRKCDRPVGVHLRRGVLCKCAL